MRQITTMTLAALLSAGTALAQDFNAGMAALERGDFAAALTEMRPLAEAGDAAAQFYLGNMYFMGDGLPQDYAEAVRLYRLAADQGMAQAQTRLGFLYDQGEFVSLDDTEAVRWYRLAADQGYASAHTLLGLMYLNGEGVRQDYIAAHMWHNIGCALGSQIGCEAREMVAVKMPTADISEAQRRARACIESNYEDCD